MNTMVGDAEVVVALGVADAVDGWRHGWSCWEISVRVHQAELVEVAAAWAVDQAVFEFLPEGVEEFAEFQRQDCREEICCMWMGDWRVGRAAKPLRFTETPACTLIPTL